MSTQVISVSDSAWTDVTAAASMLVAHNYSLQVVGNKNIELRADFSPPAIGAVGLIISVGQQDYVFNQGTDTLYAKSLGANTVSELVVTENTVASSAAGGTPVFSTNSTAATAFALATPTIIPIGADSTSNIYMDISSNELVFKVAARYGFSMVVHASNSANGLTPSITQFHNYTISPIFNGAVISQVGAYPAQENIQEEINGRYVWRRNFILQAGVADSFHLEGFFSGAGVAPAFGSSPVDLSFVTTAPPGRYAALIPSAEIDIALF